MKDVSTDDAVLPPNVITRRVLCDLTFRPIIVGADLAKLLEFAHDLFATSFDDPGWFNRRFGTDGQAYVDWLLASTGGVKAFASFALLKAQPVGMVVIGNEPNQPGVGHVFHYHLCPAAHGLDLGATLNDHALVTLAEHGLFEARLHVAPHNSRAIRFYVKQGWKTVGAVAGKGVVAMTNRRFRTSKF